MKTIKPITTISYNSQAFLDVKLQELLEGEIIDFYFYVKHYGETDEKGTKEKDHIHLYLRPACRLEMNDIPKFFVEPDPAKPDKPLTCMPCRKCNSDFDAYFYFLHDPDYLLSKGMTRQHHYTAEEVNTNDPDFLAEMLHTFPVTPFQKERKIREMVTHHATDADILNAGIDFPTFSRSFAAIHALRDGYTVRKTPSPIEKEELPTLAPVPEWRDEPSPFDVDEDGQVIFKDPQPQG